MHTPNCNRRYKLRRTFQFPTQPVTPLTLKETQTPVVYKVDVDKPGEKNQALLDQESTAVQSLDEQIRYGRAMAGVDTTLVPNYVSRDGQERFQYAGSDVTSFLNYMSGDGLTQNILKNTEPDLEVSRGGRRVTVEETKKMADEIGIDQAMLNLSTLDPKTVAANVYKTFGLLKHTQDLIRRQAQLVGTPGSSDVDAANFARLLYVYQDQLHNILGLRAAFGRGMQIMGRIQKLQPGGEQDDLIMQAAKMIRSEGGAIDDAAAMIRLSGNNSRAIAYASRGVLAKARDAAIEYWMNSVLSGVPTNMANMLSNTVTSALLVPETALAATLGSLWGGKNKVYFGEVWETMRGLVQYASQAASMSYHAFKNEMPTFGGVSGLEVSTKAIPGLLGRVVRTPSNLLMAGDEFFKRINYNASLRALLYRQARQEGLNAAQARARVTQQMDNYGEIPEALQKIAREKALYQTFTNDLDRPGALTYMGQVAIKARNKFPLLSFIIPFVRTPINIVKYAQDRSLAGLLDEEIRRQLLSGSGPERDQAIARMMFGTGIVIMAATLAAEGYLTGSGPRDPDERRTWEAAGNRAYALRIGDTTIQYNRYAPWGIVLGVASDLAGLVEVLKTDDDAFKKAQEIGFRLIGTVAKNIGDQTMITGLVNVQKAFTEPDKYLDNMIYGIAGGFIPNILAGPARTIDPALREIDDLGAALLQRVPIARGKIPPKLQVLGEERKAYTTDTPAQMAAALFLPGYQGKVAKDPVYQQLIEIEYSPAPISDTLEIGTKEYKLTQQQVNEVTLIAGPRMRQRIEYLINHSKFQSLTKEMKRDLIERVVRTERRRARKVWLSELSNQGKVSELKEKSS